MPSDETSMTSQTPPQTETNPPAETNTETAPPPSETPKAETPSAGVALTDADLVLPEGFQAVPELRSEFLEFANKNGLSKETANGLIQLQSKAMAQATESLSREFAETQANWRKEIETAYPGDKLTVAVSNIAKLVDEYGSPDLRAVMNMTGAGNNPAVFNFFAKVAEALVQEGKPAGGGSTAPVTDPAKLLFPNQN